MELELRIRSSVLKPHLWIFFFVVVTIFLLPKIIWFKFKKRVKTMYKI